MGHKKVQRPSVVPVFNAADAATREARVRLVDRHQRALRWHSNPLARRPPGFIEPRLPTLARSMPVGPQWAYEIKHDGFRFICRRDDGRVRV
jgi:ATP-dependent DNA ligase